MADVPKRERDTNRRILLLLLNSEGELNESFLAPYERLPLMGMFITGGKFNRTKLKRSLKTLAEKDFITYRESKNTLDVKLTKKGHERALRYKVEDQRIEKTDWWDRHWRIVLFDIPEEHKVARNMFKIHLDNLGFVQLQHSVYVYPYECHNEIELARTVYGIKPYVRMLVAEKIENESALRKVFEV